MVKFLWIYGDGKRRCTLRAVWAILCENTIIDQRSNNVSLIEVIDELTIPAPAPEPMTETKGEPRKFFDADLVVLWARSKLDLPEKAQMRSKIVAPNGGEARSGESEVDLTENIRLRSIGRIAGLPPFTQAGEYRIKIEAKESDSEWQEVFELPLWVSVQTDTPSE